MDSNLLSSYYFLAALAENNTDIYDSVYVPLCKRCLFRISSKKKQGTHIDVQRQLMDDYGLNVPEEIVRQLIVRIDNCLSSRERKNYGFTISDKGRYFQFETFSYDKIEEKYNCIRRGANALEEAFQEYVIAEELESKIPFQDFIDANKQKLSSYFSGGECDDLIDDSFLAHAKFLRRIEQSHHELYKAAEKAYLGSIIAAYFESGVNVDARQDSGVVYYLDTRVIFEILDLQDPESTKPAQDLLGLIRSTGGKPRVLSITVDEMTEILKKELFSFNPSHPTTTIGDACKRRDLKKLELLELQGNLANRLERDYGITVDLLSEPKIQQYRNSSDVDCLKAIGYAPSNARHDVAAYLTVREKRSHQSLVQKQDYWFVSANERLYAFNKRYKTGQFPEIVLSSELTSLLFLRNPKLFASAVSSQGLGSLIALTLTEEFADRDLINQLDRVIKGKVVVSDEDYNLLIDYLATESTKRLNRVIDDVSQKTVDEASEQVHEIVSKARAEREKEAQSMRELEKDKESSENERRRQEEINQELETRLSNSEKQMANVSSTLIKQDDEIRRLKRIDHRWWFMLIGIIVFAIGVFLQKLDNIADYINRIGVWIKGAGGLWAFLNFILNLLAKVRK